MGQPRVGRRDRRGGETIPSLRPHRPRFLIQAGALACALALAAYPVIIASSRRPIAAAVGGAAIVILLAGLAGRSKAATLWGIAALGVAYADALIDRGGGIDPGAPLYAALLFACAELADWSIDVPRSVAWDRAVGLQRLRALAVSTAAGAAGAAVVTVTADFATAGAGVTPTVLGTICMVTFVGLLALLAREAGPSESD